jgi:uncharacterized protein
MNRLEKLLPLVKPYYSSTDPAHDWAHVERVALLAKVLSEQLEVNLEWVLAAVYCHDLINLPKNHPDRKKASHLSADEAEALLKLSGFQVDEIKVIQDAIVQHSYSNGSTPTHLESAILQDADRLDALGAVGILRCASVNAKMESTFYDPNDPFAEGREHDDKKFMIDHYFVKLFKLPELMTTPMGKSLAYKRVEFMKRFLQELECEIRVSTCGS